MTSLTAQEAFALYLYAVTVDAPPTNALYVKEAHADWSWNGDGTIAGVGHAAAWAPSPESTITGDPAWTADTDGSQPVTTGMTMNYAVSGPTYNFGLNPVGSGSGGMGSAGFSLQQNGPVPPTPPSYQESITITTPTTPGTYNLDITIVNPTNGTTVTDYVVTVIVS